MKALEYLILTIAAYLGAWIGTAISDQFDVSLPEWACMTLGALILWGAAFAAMTTDIVITVKP